MVKVLTNKCIVAAFLAGPALGLGCIDSADDRGGATDRSGEIGEIVENLLAAGFSEEDIEIREGEVVEGGHRLAGREEQVFVDGEST